MLRGLVTHWTTRTLAKELGTSKAFVRRVWIDNGQQPHRTKTSFAALSVTDGTLIAPCQQRHRHLEWN